MEYDESYYVCCLMELDAKPNTKSELKYCHLFGHPLFNVIFFFFLKKITQRSQAFQEDVVLQTDSTAPY